MYVNNEIIKRKEAVGIEVSLLIHTITSLLIICRT